MGQFFLQLQNFFLYEIFSVLIKNGLINCLITQKFFFEFGDYYFFCHQGNHQRNSFKSFDK